METKSLTKFPQKSAQAWVFVSISCVWFVGAAGWVSHIEPLWADTHEFVMTHPTIGIWSNQTAQFEAPN